MKRRAFIAGLAGAVSSWPLAAHAQQFVGGWRATNPCFLVAFVLMEGGRAQASYVSGERDDNAVWTWDGSTLRITSATFPLDRFTGHRVEPITASTSWRGISSMGKVASSSGSTSRMATGRACSISSPSCQAHQHPARDDEHGPQ
jgi:hypothetical protein